MIPQFLVVANAALLLVRLSVIVFIVWGVVFCFRNGIAGDRRQIYGLLSGLAVGALALTELALSFFAAPDASARMGVAIMIPNVLIVGVIVGAACYAGIRLGDSAKGYWTKTTTDSRRQAIIAILMGAVVTLLGSLIVLCCFAVPINPPPRFSGPELMQYGLRILAFSFGEEVFYRGWIQAFLTEKMAHVRHGRTMALLTAALVFAAQHVGGPYQLPVLLNTMLAGLVFGKIFEKHGSVAAAVTHLLANLLATYAVPYFS